MAADAGGGPGAAGGDVLHHPYEVVHRGVGAAEHAEHEVELHGHQGQGVAVWTGDAEGAGHLAFAGHVDDGLQVAHLEAFVFGLDAFLDHALAEGAHGGHGVVEDVVAEVAGAAVQRGHLGHRGGVGRVQTLVGGHADGAAGAGNEDDVGALFEDGLGALLEALVALRGGAVVVAHVEVHDGGAGVNGALGFAHNLLHGVGHIGVLLFGDFGAADGGGDDEFIHSIPKLIFNFQFLIFNLIQLSLYFPPARPLISCQRFCRADSLLSLDSTLS